jgi:hypothetical protein
LQIPPDPGDVDFYTSEQKQQIHDEWLRSELGQKFQKEMKRGELVASIGRVAAWLVIGSIVLVVGAAVLKWALEELAK